MAQRVVEPRWTRDRGRAVRGCSEQMVMGAGEGVGWARMPGRLVSSNRLKGGEEEVNARGSYSIKESSGAASSQI